MTQKGAHTWDLVLHYHRCPQCGQIMESREDYSYSLGKYTKDVECTKCHHVFTLVKLTKPSIGPFFGEKVPAEWEWC